jgi:TonB family protein
MEIFGPEDSEDTKSRVSVFRRIGWWVLGLGVLGALVTVVITLFQGTSVPQRHTVTTVTQIVLPPPPPPPPKPPEPEKKVEEQPKPEPAKIQEPKQQPKPDLAPPKPKVAAPPGNPLTAAAGAGSNQYGLGVGNGGGDVVGGGGGGGGNAFGYYAGLLSSQVKSAIQRDDKTRYGRWRVGVKVWLGPSGNVTRAQLVSSTGDPAIDGAISRLLAGLSVGEPPPQNMPQPVNLRIGAEPG